MAIARNWKTMQLVFFSLFWPLSAKSVTSLSMQSPLVFAEDDLMLPSKNPYSEQELPV